MITGITRTDIRRSRVGDKKGWCFDVYFGARTYPNLISALYKTRQETQTKLADYIMTGKIEFYGSAEI